jgi:hypothetical protein
MGHAPFLVLSDYLTRLGFAVLAGIEFLKSRKEIDPARIGLMGHSEGCAIASLAAAKAGQAAFVVLMAGGGAPGDRVLLQQDSESARASGAAEAKIKQDLDTEARLYEVVRREKDTAAAEKRVRGLLGSAPGAVGEYARTEETIAPAALDAIGN